MKYAQVQALVYPPAMLILLLYSSKNKGKAVNKAHEDNDN